MLKASLLQLDIHMQKNEIEYLLHTIYKDWLEIRLKPKCKN